MMVPLLLGFALGVIAAQTWHTLSLRGRRLPPLADPDVPYPPPPLRLRSFDDYTQLEVAAGRWHYCASAHDVRPTSVLDCSHCRDAVI